MATDLKSRVRSLEDCHNVNDFRALAQRKLPFPVFHYIDGAADDELTKDRNTAAFDDVDLVPNVLVGVERVDPTVTILGKTTRLPLILSPTALQRLFHWQGERAVAAAAEKFGLWFGISSLASVSIAEIGERFAGPKMLQYYYHKDKGLNAALLEMARAAKFDAVTLTVDTIVGCNRERCLRTGFTSPPKITAASAFSYASKPRWALDYLFREKFSLPNLEAHVAAGTNVATSIQSYFSQMLDQSMDWAAAEKLRRDWGGKFVL
jgi:L-lactate dehydrogenase (cytochrome)